MCGPNFWSLSFFFRSGIRARNILLIGRNITDPVKGFSRGFECTHRRTNLWFCSSSCWRGGDGGGLRVLVISLVFNFSQITVSSRGQLAISYFSPCCLTFITETLISQIELNWLRWFEKKMKQTNRWNARKYPVTCSNFGIAKFAVFS